MDLRKLKTLIDLVSESNIAELEITEAEGKVRIVKANVASAAAVPLQIQPALTVAIPATPAPGSPAAVALVEPPEETGHVITSPMVGTFYRSSSPGGTALVEVGSSVKEGESICIIEAMKIMNEIESTHSGTITKILCENGQAVEFGQPLFVVQ